MDYYNKAKILKEIAKFLEKKNGKIPNNKQELMKLNGVGDYISSAVLTFAFSKNLPIVDSNIKRFTYRFWNLTNLKEIKERLFKFTQEDPRSIYFGLLDICWYYCRAPKPKCEECPIKENCQYFKRKQMQK